MAARYINGLNLVNPSDAAGDTGRTLCRFIYEWLTQVVGWTSVDADAAPWTALLTPMEATASSVTGYTNRIAITTAAYVFTTSNIGDYLTFPSFAAPYEDRAGIYRIVRLVSVVGNTYTLELDTRYGVHTDGIPPGQVNRNWRLWRAHSTYCPAAAAVAVVQGTGRTGAGLNVAHGTGDGFTFGAGNVTVECLTANFQASDVGKTITIAGATSADNNGSFVIASVADTHHLTYANALGVTEAFTGTWDISYNFQIHMTVKAIDATNAGYPTFIAAPWCSWDPAANAWLDAKHTTAKGMDTYLNSIWDPTSIRVWGYADTDHFMICTRQEDVSKSWIVAYGGEVKAFYPDVDPRPVIIVTGSNNGTNDNSQLLGTGIDSNIGAAWLAADETTNLAGFLAFAHCSPSSDVNWISTLPRRWSTFSRRMIRQEIALQSRTAGNMEWRGVLKDTWVTARDYSRVTPFGGSSEYLHVMGGITLPWNGSKIWYERG